MAECSGKNCTLIRKLLDSKALTCQSCKKLLQIPVFLVEGVGNVCEHCTVENEWKKQAIRNEIFNVFLDELIIPCAHANVGCGEEISYKHFEEHSKLCKYRPVKCPDRECTWMERHANLPKHFMESHKENVIESDTFQFKLSNVQEESKINFTKLLIKRCLKYLFILKQDETNDELACTLFTFHNDGLSSTNGRVMFRSSLGKEYSFKIDLHLLNSIDQEYYPEKIDLRSIKSFLHEDELSMIVDLPPADSLLQDLECPICNEFMGPPIFQCSIGHTICKTCVKRWEKCPTCTAVVSKMIRNYHIETKTRHMFYPCPYKASGCTAILSGENIMDHETKCLYHLYQCPLDCDFQYNSKTVLNHLSVKHGNISNKFKFECAHGCYTLPPDQCKSFMYIDGDFFQFTYNCTNAAVTIVNLEFKKLNLDKQIGPLYCKITLRNLTNKILSTQIQHFKDIRNNNSKINSSTLKNTASSSKIKSSNNHSSTLNTNFNPTNKASSTHISFAANIPTLSSNYSLTYNPNFFNPTNATLPSKAESSSKMQPTNNFPLGNFYNDCYYIPVPIGALAEFIDGSLAGILEFTCELLME